MFYKNAWTFFSFKTTTCQNKKCHLQPRVIIPLLVPLDLMFLFSLWLLNHTIVTTLCYSMYYMVFKWWQSTAYFYIIVIWMKKSQCFLYTGFVESDKIRKKEILRKFMENLLKLDKISGLFSWAVDRLLSLFHTFS